MKRRKDIPCRWNITSAGPKVVSGSDNGKDNTRAAGWEQAVGVMMGDASGKPVCAELGVGQRMVAFLRAKGSHFRLESWLTKFDLHLKNISGCIWRLA